MKTYNKHLIIVGTARSGTSWLSELVARPFRYRLLYEPEHETRTKDGYLICDRWLSKNNTTYEVHQYLKQVLSNAVDCDWIAQSSNRKYKMHLWPLLPKRYIIKMVRGNLVAPYLNDVFQIPVLHMIRNPYDTLMSQRRANFEWLTNLSIFASQSELVDMVIEVSGIDITNLKEFSTMQCLALRWCIENVLLLEVFKPYKNKHRIVKYEDLYHNTDLYLELCDYFNLESIPQFETFIKRPSTKTHRNSNIRKGEASKYEWNAVDLEQVNDILDQFNINLYERKTQ